MKSTGEVMGIDRDYNVAFVKSQLGGGTRLPKTGTVFVSVKDADKPRILEATRLLAGLGFRIMATSGTQRYWPSTVSRRSRSTRSPKAGRTSSTPSKTAKSSWFSTPPKGPRRWSIAGRSGAQPSCIKCRITPLSQGPSPQRRASGPISGATSRCVRCRAISGPGLIKHRGGRSDGTCRARVRDRRPDNASARDQTFDSAGTGG